MRKPGCEMAMERYNVTAMEMQQEISSPGFEFERFTEVNKSFSARITIRQNGQIGFNGGARNQYGVASHRFAVLFFDRNSKAVGILLTDNEQEPGALRITSTKQNTFIAGRPFLELYGISYEKSRRFRLEKRGDLLVFELEKPLNSALEKPLDPVAE